MEKKQLELWKKHHRVQQQQRDSGNSNNNGGLVALQTKGRALKVHTGDTPHLVSLGGDRFSTAVTLHPIPHGHVKLGCGSDVDIPIFGTGVEELHCWIENKDGVVTLHPYPVVENIFIDGLKVSQATRLTQGCMLCLGRSNFLRFNHPQEARYMRSVMPNTRVSIMPNVFYPSNNMADNGTNVSFISNSKVVQTGIAANYVKATGEYCFSKHISPKVFPPGSSTLNSPASVVLGYKYSNHLSLAHYQSANISRNTSEHVVSDSSNSGGTGKEVATTVNTGYYYYDKNNNGITASNDDKENDNRSLNGVDDNSNDITNGTGNGSIVGSSESVHQQQKQRLAIPSPAFDRNPTYFNGNHNQNRHSGPVNHHGNLNSPSSEYGDYGGNISPISLSSSPRSIVTSCGSTNGICDVSLPPLRRFSPVETNLSSPNYYSPSSLISFNELTTTTNGYTSDGSLRKNGIVARRNQVHNNRIIEKEKERLERLRLEEILTLCAEYEKQAQFDRSKSQLSKIKTNGSLPRDKKQCPATPSSGCKTPRTPDSPRNGLVVFTFDKSDNNTNNNICNDGDGQCTGRDAFYPSSPRSRIKTVASPKDHSREHALEIFENKLAILNNCEILNVSTNTRRCNISKERRGKVHAATNNESTYPADDKITHNEGFDSNHNCVVDDSNSNNIDIDDNDSDRTVKATNKISSLKEMNIRNRYKFFGVNPEEWHKKDSAIEYKSIDAMFQSYHCDHDDRDEKSKADKNKVDMYSSLIELGDKHFHNGSMNFCRPNRIGNITKTVSSEFVRNDIVNTNDEESAGVGNRTDNDSDIEKLNGLVIELNEIVKETELSLSCNDSMNNKRNRGNDNRNNNNDASSGFHSDDSINHSTISSGGSGHNDDTSHHSDTNEGSSSSGINEKIADTLKDSEMCRSKDDSANNNNNDSRFILPLERINTVLRKQCFTLKRNQLKKLQDEQASLLAAINDIKLKLGHIQQQKDEIMKELEMEKALIEAEFRAENSKLVKEEETLSGIQIKVKDCESAIEVCSKSQMERQAHNTEMINEKQAILTKLEQSLSDIRDENARRETMEDIRKKREHLEDEVKKFEDFEFKLLEEEAVLLSKREELQVESHKVNCRIEELRCRVSGLFTQKEQLLENASDEIRCLELQVRNHTSNLQQNHRRLQEISSQLKTTARSLSEISECDTDSSEDIITSGKTQSQEDLDRISRVTSDAPIMESRCTNSLGRRTIASLQEIERNRQLHLAQQGSQVIEEERKRVLALKQRVQSEVKAKWEQQKQRENCNSFNSDNSGSLTSFERVTESPSNDEGKKFSEDDSTGDSIDIIESKDLIPSTTNSLRGGEEEKVSRRRNPSNASSHHGDSNSSTVNLRHNKLIGGYNSQRPESQHSVRKRESFDLRRHIESAGHLLERCPQVIVDSTSCRGYLHKMTTKFRTWNKRWFVFDRTKCSFVYFADKSEKKMRAGTYFQGLIDLHIDKGNMIKSPHSNATFVVKSSERTFYLMAPSVEVMRIWFDVIATEVDVYHDT